jgi:DNA-binding NtrC family response regulator
MDGLELANQASRLRPGLRVLLTSGFPGGHGADQRLADSPIRLLDKPYSLGELAQAVRRVLDGGDNRTQCNDRGAEARPAEETEQS